MRLIASSRPGGSSTSRSPLPRIATARSPSPRRRARTSAAIGPAMTSPPNAIRSTSSRSTSASTASSAGRLPWTSSSTATRVAIAYCAGARTAACAAATRAIGTRYGEQLT
jgi:hypothetical protein